MDRIGWSSLLIAFVVVSACADKRSDMLPTGSRPESVDALESDPIGLLQDVSTETTLTFVFDGQQKTVTVSALLERFQARELELQDPNYQARKRFVAIPLLPTLEFGFGLESSELAGKRIVFEALDGYASPVAGDVVTRTGGFLALDDLDVEGWASVGEKQADPAPLYIVWTGSERDPKVYPWPWALRTVRIVAKDEYAAASPGDDATDVVKRGHSLFLSECIRCHAMNRVGGRLGPELNVPLSIVEYRPEKQIKAYIHNPLTFRYGNMPGNPHLSDADLSALLAYFRAMKDRKVEVAAK